LLDSVNAREVAAFGEIGNALDQQSPLLNFLFSSVSCSTRYCLRESRFRRD
jgi:hypothetical protein